MERLTCFKAYDIRGKLGDELNDDIAYRVGRAFGQVLFCSGMQSQSVVVGGDVRLTFESLKMSLAAGLMDSGINVIDIVMVVGTEEVYFATKYLKVSSGVEVTASHNPLDYNGMKLVCEDAKPVSGTAAI